MGHLPTAIASKGLKIKPWLILVAGLRLDYRTAFLTTLGQSDAVAVAGLLLSAGASIDACDRKGRTSLHLAVNANSGNVNTSTEMEQFLLDKGANQFARDWLQRLPLHYVFVKIGKYVAYATVVL